MYKLSNIMEQMVFNVIDELAEDQQFCNCGRCRLDIAAIALNNLPHHYTVTEKGEAYSRAGRLELQKDLDVVGAVFAAIKAVQKKPRHR